MAAPFLAALDALIEAAHGGDEAEVARLLCALRAFVTRASLRLYRDGCGNSLSQRLVALAFRRRGQVAAEIV